jgi:hypothetical protein
VNEYMRTLQARVGGMSPEQRLEAAAEELRSMDRRDKKAEYFGERETAWYYGTRDALEIILGLEPGSLDTGAYDPDTDTEADDD